MAVGVMESSCSRDTATVGMSICVLADVPWYYDGSQFTRCLVDLPLCAGKRTSAPVPGVERCCPSDRGMADQRSRLWGEIVGKPRVTGEIPTEVNFQTPEPVLVRRSSDTRDLPGRIRTAET